MSPEKLDQLARLQDLERRGLLDTIKREQLRLLRVELAMAPEVADNPVTLFTDESRRPQLDGTDWNERNRQLACDEVTNFAKMLVARFGVPLAEAALQAGIAALKG